MPHNASIIFVDDDRNVLRGLRRRMLSQRPNRTMRFYEGAEQALIVLDEQPDYRSKLLRSLGPSKRSALVSAAAF